MDNKKPQPQQKFTKPVYESTAAFDIDATLKEELEAKGLEYHFIDYKKAMENGGQSRSGWWVYKRESKDPRTIGLESHIDNSGLVRQGTMVLGVRTKQDAELKRRRRDEQTRHLNRYTQTVTQELDRDARRLGGSSRIIAGYDKNS